MSLAGPDFLVLTGFLGSGKTTLLREFMSRAEAGDTAIIVNEVGEIGLDGMILRESGADVSVAMLANGCVCCALGSDLAITVDLLLSTERPAGAEPLRRIVLETSGLSKPGPVLRQLATLAEHRMRVGVVATYDVSRGSAVAAFEEAAAQWAAAHRIVATKLDVAGSNAAGARLVADIAGMNPVAEIIATQDRAEAVTAAFAPLSATAPMPTSRPALMASHPRINLFLARPDGVVAYDDLAAWLDNLAGALGERLLRLKGLVRVRECPAPLLVQSVGTLFSPPRPFAADDAESFLVVIARDVAAEEIAAVTPADVFSIGTAPAEEAMLCH